MLFKNRVYIKHQDIQDHESLRSRDSHIPHSIVQPNIVWSRHPILKSLVY